MVTEADSARPEASRSTDLMRLFAWGTVGFLVIFLLNAYLVNGLRWPAISSLPGTDWRAWLLLALYLAGGFIVWRHVNRSRETSLRNDAARITSINTYIIRSLFWSVLFVGIADMAVSFLRVEGLLPLVVNEQLAKDLGKPLFRGPWLHLPLLALGFVVGSFTRTLGFHWLALLIVIAELLIVITRFIFSYEQAFMGDLVRFWYAALFLFASAYTLLEEGHVRVDVFYAGMKRKSRGFVNAFGAIALGMSLCWTIIFIGFGGKSAIIYGPMANFEVSQSGFGMYTKYWMAGFLGVFAITMLLQFVAQFLESCADYRNDPGGRDIAEPVAAS